MRWFRPSRIMQGTFPRNLGDDPDALPVMALSILVSILTAGLLYIPLLAKVVYQAAKTRASTRQSGVYLVFGKQLINGSPDQDYRLRLDRLLCLPCQLTILLGGRTGGQPSEAQAGYDYLRVNGFPHEMLRLEQSSRNTLDNLRNARPLLSEQRRPLCIVISNRYHLTRCSVIADSLNIPHSLCAAEKTLTVDSHFILRCLMEAFYLHWFYTGKYWALATGNRRLQERIT